MSENLMEMWESVVDDVNMSVPFDLRDCAKLVFRVGSHSHGTYVPPEDEHGIDDVDLMVICVPPAEFKLGLKQWEHATYKHGRWDVVLYDWQKWLHMIYKSNPNVVGTLWLEPEDVLELDEQWGEGYLYDPYGDLLAATCENKILSKRMYDAFVGYAHSQLYKMTHCATQGYMGDKRKRLVEKYGFDVKNAAHLIRLLRMACEAFETGVLNVRRADAAEIITIKQGGWSLEQVATEAQALFTRAEAAMKVSSLREEPDAMFLQKIMVQGYKASW